MGPLSFETTGAGGFLPVSVGETVRLKKAHPCGGRDWRVTRTGADIGLECLTCGRRVFLTRDEFERRSVARPSNAVLKTDGDRESETS